MSGMERQSEVTFHIDPAPNGTQQVRVVLDALALEGLRQGQVITVTLDEINAKRVGISQITVACGPGED